MPQGIHDRALTLLLLLRPMLRREFCRLVIFGGVLELMLPIAFCRSRDNVERDAPVALTMLFQLCPLRSISTIAALR